MSSAIYTLVSEGIYSHFPTKIVFAYLFYIHFICLPFSSSLF